MKIRLPMLLIAGFLLACRPDPGFVAHKLTRCMVYDISDSAPEFTRIHDEGDVAYYGLILQATGQRELRDYLLAKKRDHLWEYNWDYGVTAEDSAIVMDGLLSSGVKPAQLLASAERISREYYVQSSGGFRTVLNPRSAYWDKASVVTTGHIAWLLRQISPVEFSGQTESAARFLQKTQLPDGSWKGEWFPSRTIPSYYSLRFLATNRLAYASELRRGTEYLRGNQQADGSWSNSVIETSAAILGLQAADNPGFKKEIEQGRHWLREKIRHSVQGEAVLYYWFERKGSKSREFLHCSDLGEVTKAWALLALKD